MINPYESNKVYSKKWYILGDQTIISMTQSLRHVIKQTLSYYDTLGQEILLFNVPLPTNPIDPIDPIDQITYEFILNFILFDGEHYTFEEPWRFGMFFYHLNWNSARPPSLTDSFLYVFSIAWNYVISFISFFVVNVFLNSFLNTTWSPIMSMPLCVFNFFMNLPFVVFNFDSVKNTNPKPVGTQSDSVAFLGHHFEPVFTRLFTSIEIKRLINQYYTNDPISFEQHMGDMLKSLYTMSHENPTVIHEARAETYFSEVLKPICDFISFTSGRDLTIIHQEPITVNVTDFMGTIPNEDIRHLRPDLVIYEGTQAKIVIEMKAPPLFKGFKVPQFYKLLTSLSECIGEGDNVSKGESTRVHEILKQLLVYMIGLKCLRGMLSDGYTVILVEIDCPKLEKQDEENQVNEIPLKLKTFDCKSSNPSYLQGNLYFLIKGILEPIPLNDKLLHFQVVLHTREEVIKGSNMGIGDNTSNTLTESKGQSIFNAPNSPLFISWEDKPKVLQNVFDYLSHVVKIKAKFVKNYILEDIDDEDEVVVKIFDPKLTRIDKLDRPDIIENVNTFYRREKRSAEVLTSKSVDTLYLKQVYGNAIYNYGYGPLIKGKFIVSKYVAPEKLPITTEVFKMAREQLSKIHELGIAHGDIREQNILFNKEYNKVYLIDFGHAIIKGSNDDKSDILYADYGSKKDVDRDCLAEIFLDVIK